MEGPKETEKLQMSSAYSRLGNKTIELKNICKKFGDLTLIKDFNYIFLANDRIGIVGENGCGKSTLMKIITGELVPDSGTLEIGQTVKIGYFSQENEHLPENIKVIDYIRDTAEFVQTADGQISAVKMLERFLFNSTLQYQMISKLSGGEKRRLYLLKILMEAPNVLILDEPTNDLDIATMMVLEDYLDTFGGIVISVSHDRYFLNRMANRIFAYEKNELTGEATIKQYEGNYDDYIEKSGIDPYNTARLKAGSKANNNGNASGEAEDLSGSNGQASASSANGKPKNTKLKMSYNEAREFERIDDEIMALEEKLEKLEQDITTYARDFVKLNEATKEKEKVE
jgi:ATP-binding cassette subfamily F protein uup